MCLLEPSHIYITVMMVMTKLFCNLISYLKKNIHTYHMFKVAILMLGAHKRAMYNEEY